MTKGYQHFEETEKFISSRVKLLENDKNALTLNADETFPENPLLGMPCYRTDLKKLFVYSSDSGQGTWKPVVNKYGSTDKLRWEDVENPPTFTSSWLELTDLPESFTPSAHSHAVSEITGLSQLFDGVNEAIRSTNSTLASTQRALETTQTKLDTKLNKTDLKRFGTVDVIRWGDIENTSHTHPMSDINGLSTELANLKSSLQSVTTKSTENQRALNENQQAVAANQRALETKLDKTSLLKYGKQTTVQWGDIRNVPSSITNPPPSYTDDNFDNRLNTLVDIALATQENTVAQTTLDGLRNEIAHLTANLSTVVSKITNAKFVVESGSNDNGWWRKWSDGWLEQGGFLPRDRNRSWKTITVTYPKAFRDAQYTLVALNSYTAGNAFGWNVVSKTTSSCQMYGADAGGDREEPGTWYACGFGG